MAVKVDVRVRTSWGRKLPKIDRARLSLDVEIRAFLNRPADAVGVVDVGVQVV